MARDTVGRADSPAQRGRFETKFADQIPRDPSRRSSRPGRRPRHRDADPPQIERERFAPPSRLSELKVEGSVFPPQSRAAPIRTFNVSPSPQIERERFAPPSRLSELKVEGSVF